ncbi:hypothetical protein SH2C18_20440 [Clostridium sediminicola]
MVLRETRRGPNKGKKFYECSNYPIQRYIIDKDNNRIKSIEQKTFTELGLKKKSLVIV